MSTTPKEIIFEEEARLKLSLGIKKLADVVAFTLGPNGRNVGLESYGVPKITNDGSSIVKDIQLEDPLENMGASMAKEVVQKQKEVSGDGTTTATLLLRTLVDQGIRQISAGTSPIGIKRGIDKAVEAVIQELQKISTPVKGSLEIKNIATASASGNIEIGNLIAEAMEKVKNSGVVTIEEAKGMATTIEIVEGMQFDRGYISPYFCTNAEKMTVEMQKPAILLLDKKVTSIHELLPILQQIATTGKQLLIIAEDIDGDALSTLVVNKLKGTLKVAAVKSPGFGDARKSQMQDIAALTGATLVAEETGDSLKELTVDSLGSADKVTITKDHTLIVGGAGTHETISARLKMIENEIKNTTGYEKEKLQERKAKLSGGVAVIRVGAATEPEMKQLKQVFEDSLSSTKSALDQGIVPGGGVALLRASKAIGKLNLQGEEALGGKIVEQMCETPIKQIITNAGLDSSVVLSEILKKEGTFGFNAVTNTVEDLMKAGVIDPTKVVKTALTHASSVGGTLLLTEAIITDAKEEQA